ncbi:glycosyltransferase family 39 protein [Candidatus Oscillochloris fontis]|uniref:glycosyltransferase family 39 protein n=1 Tax=Candidatus Oscillochloris fontis TaxID=2496868 RepID=UPI001EE8A72B|nr:glycosyltransferase family 39 protein [Candidatus Oscillochloris fontis]
MRRLQHPLVAPLVLFGFALALRLYHLDAQSLWLDEGSSWQVANLPWADLLRDLVSPSAAYPLYHLLLKLWIMLAGDSEAMLRLPSALAGAAAVPVIYLAGRVGNPHARLAPLASALIAMVGPFPLWYAQEAKAYSLLLLAAALLVWAGMRALHPPSLQVLTQRREGAEPATKPCMASTSMASTSSATATAPLAELVEAMRRIPELLRANKPSRLRAFASIRGFFTYESNWRSFALIALVALSIHRLAALVVLAIGWAWVVQRRPGWKIGVIGMSLASAGLVGVMALGLGSDRAATGAYIPAGPLDALWLTFTRFSLDRWPGDAAWWWLLPWGLLFIWGMLGLVRDLRRPLAQTWLCLLLVPLVLFGLQLLFTRLYEARYLIVVYPIWVLVLGYPLRRVSSSVVRHSNRRGDRGTQRDRFHATSGSSSAFLCVLCGQQPERKRMPIGIIPHLAPAILLLLALATSTSALLTPPFGLFSGAAVKEQYREAIRELALRVHPDDAVVVHPSYIRPLYDYYMRQMSTDPAPTPLVFADFWQGETAYGQREWDIERRANLAGYSRSFLLIAPDHARTVDAPAPGDEYGLVGNFWAFSREQRTWPCGIWRYHGVHLFCQEAPETYITGERISPATPVGVTFAQQLIFQGFTLKAWQTDPPGVYRAGGNLPISLFWDVTSQPSEDFSFFLHLCQDCSAPPVAGDDGQPLAGYLPTSTWLPGKPARDDRTIALPADLPAGRYTLLLGIYRPSNPAPDARLQVEGGMEDGRFVLGSVEIIR